MQEALRQKIHTALSSSLDDRAFNSLAIEVSKYQYENNQSYRRYCQYLGQNSPPKTWTDILPIVTDCYKLHDTLPCSFQGSPKAVFHTSGTTTDLSGYHAFFSLDLYQRSVLEAWKALGPAPLEQTFILARHARHSPHSSLLRMFQFLVEEWKADESAWIMNTDSTFDLSALKSTKQPIALLGTALNFLSLFEQLKDTHLTLPAGSWAMETGGYKATGISIEKHDLYQLFSEKLGIPTDNVWNEYSMTELSSQFYTKGLGKPHTGPSWTRTRIIDPETQKEVAIGEIGYLVIYDLANFDSVIAIQTQDFAIREEQGFTLIGRDPSALPRGCSRALI